MKLKVATINNKNEANLTVQNKINILYSPVLKV